MAVPGVWSNLCCNMSKLALSNPRDVAVCVQGQVMRDAAQILTQTARLESKANNQQIGQWSVG
jgi:hypothetical protein